MFLSSPKEINSKQDGKKRVVILGGGTLGIYMAVRLSADFDEVVILEAGEKELGNFNSKTFKVVGRPHDGIAVGRSKSVGGTSNLWGGQLVEFQPIDFANRSWMPSGAWPVSYEEIARHFPETYTALGVPDKFQKDAAILDSVMADRPNFGANNELFLTRWMNKPSMAVLFSKELEESPKIKFATSTWVTGFNYSGDNIVSVNAKTTGGDKFEIEGDVFVMALGTIENARLLLAAQVDQPTKCPWIGNTVIGKRFQDHLGIHVGTLDPIDKKLFYRVFSNLTYQGRKYQPKLRRTSSNLDAQNELNIQVSVSFEAAMAENLVFLKQFLKAAIFGRSFKNVGQFVKALMGSLKYLPPLMWRYIVEHRVFVPSGGKIRLYFQCEQIPIDRSVVTIDPSDREGDGLPRVNLDWQVDGRELASIHKFAVEIKEIFEKVGLAKLELDPKLVNQSADYLEQARDTIHHAGGVIMGASPEVGVVDSNLRVFGTQNLYAAGACVFPSSSSANTTFMALSFGTRLCEHLKSKSA